MNSYVIDLHDVDRTKLALVGGKGAHLGELTRIQGVQVPPGFCVTTAAFRRITGESPHFGDQLHRLLRLLRVKPDDRQGIGTLSAEIRRTIEEIAIPGDLAEEIARHTARLGERLPYAVRSSATAEDSPTTSFAGLHDTYLSVVGAEAVVRHVRRCWASLFTERAVTYRFRRGLATRDVSMAVVVQQMVFPQASGVLFTADPVTGNRHVASVEAVFGLGEELVSGMTSADVYKVRDGRIIAHATADKSMAVYASPRAGTQERAVGAGSRGLPALTDEQVVELVELGRRIEAHFGSPQDIEWCFADGEFFIVQSRPITTLFPIPRNESRGNRVYVSVGHQQMMTDAMKPLGISFWRLTAGRPMYEAGGRLFVDVTDGLASPASRSGLLEALGRSDPLIRDALETVIARGDFIRALLDQHPDLTAPGRPTSGCAPAPMEPDPAIVIELMERGEASIAALKRAIRNKSGTALFDFILEDIQELRGFMFDPQSMQVIMAAMEAAWWLNERLETWLGEENAADTLTQSVPYNVTSEMGLALLDVADVIRPHPEVVAFLENLGNVRPGDEEIASNPRIAPTGKDEKVSQVPWHVQEDSDRADARDDSFLDEIARLEGGREASDAIRNWLSKYGMRCAGEIDITRPRWSEHPNTLVPLILGNVKNFEPGAARRLFEQGRQQAMKKERDVLERLRALPDGEHKAADTKRMIDTLRTFIGYREYPKYHMVSRYYVYKEALLEEAKRLVRDRVLRKQEDIFFLTFHELHDVVRTRAADQQLILHRKEEFKAYEALTPPRVLTSEGEVIAGEYRKDDLPDQALVGLPVSSGVVEGRARVIHELDDANLEPDDILVTTHTDPSWTPLFVTVKGLVTEVGGLMTHGAVIAREYGLPAVVGVERAKQRIRDGARIRVNGTEGFIEILE